MLPALPSDYYSFNLGVKFAPPGFYGVSANTSFLLPETMKFLNASDKFLDIKSINGVNRRHIKEKGELLPRQ